MTQSLGERPDALPFFVGGGQAGALLRAMDWSRSPLGPPRDWPQTLKNAIRLILDNGAPMYIAWGPELTQFYNDGYLPILGQTKHPGALGRSTRDTFKEIWATIGPMFDDVLQGKSVFHEDLNLPLERNGQIADSYFTFSYSPLRDDLGNISGVFVVAIETTAKKIALLESKLAQETLHRQMMQAPIGIAVLEGPSHIFRLTNPNYVRLLPGKTEGDLLNRSVAEALPEVVEQGFTLLLDQVYATGIPFLGKEVPLRIRQAEGSEKKIFVDFTYHPSRDANGTITGILVVATDVTEQIAAREYVRNENLWLEEVLNRLPTALIMAQPGSGIYRFANKTAKAWLGQTPNGRPDLSPGVLTVRNSEGQVLDNNDTPSARAARGEPVVNEVIILEQGSSRRYVSCNSSVIPPIYGHEETVLIPFLDVTDLKAKEAKVAFERHQLETIFEHSPAAMALWAGPNFIFERVNPHYQAIFPDRILLGKPFVEALPEFQGQIFTDLLKQVLETGEPFVGREVLARHATHAGGPIEDHYYDFTYMRVNDADGKPYGVYDHAIDVTERVLDRRRLEGAMREAEQAKNEAHRANQLKSSFLANMSHEIRTPLGAMIGFTELLRRPEVTESERANYLEILARNGKQLSVIIDDILDLSKVEAGRLTLEFLPTNPAVIASDVLTLLQMKARDKGLTLDYECGPTTPTNITTDPVRVRQVLINLIGNSIKFTRHGSVKFKSYAFDAGGGSQGIGFEISDTGIGLETSQIESIFEMFVQADGSMTRRYGGTGIGLALSRNLARALGGDIEVKSTAPNQGSTFLFTFRDSPERSDLPARAIRIKTDDPRPWSKENPLRGIRVLVVDDSSDNQQLIWHFLTGAGAIVELADNGIEGCEKAMNGDHQVILMDVQMPLMDGYTATQSLRKRGYEKPILALTAHAMDDVRKRCMAAGYTDHLAKPINPQELVGAIAHYATLS